MPNKRYKHIRATFVHWGGSNMSAVVKISGQERLRSISTGQIVNPPRVMRKGDEIVFRGRKIHTRMKHKNKYAAKARSKPAKKAASSSKVEDQKDQEQKMPLPDETPEFIGITSVGGTIRLLSLSRDGTYRFLDEHQSTHHIWHISTPEEILLENALVELEWLINDHRTNESKLQKFFEKHPYLILNDEYREAHPHIVLEKSDGRNLIPDFVLEPLEQTRLCDILDLKRPDASIFVLKKNRPRFTAAILEAAAQLREYASFFDEQENRDKIYKQYGLLAYKPRMIVLIGRRGAADPLLLRKMESDLPNLTLRTYDDVIARVKGRIDSIRRHQMMTRS